MGYVRRLNAWAFAGIGCVPASLVCVRSCESQVTSRNMGTGHCSLVPSGRLRGRQDHRKCPIVTATAMQKTNSASAA